MRHRHLFSCILVAVALCVLWPGVVGFACNWGRIATQPLQGEIVVQLLKDNGFDKVKLFDADAEALKALANSGIQVMVGIDNGYLQSLGNNIKASDDWVAQNVSAYIKNGVDIRYVAVSNEAFLKDYKDKYIHKVLPALKNIKASLDKAGLGKKVQVTIPINADIYETDNDLPSGGDFRANVTKEVVEILKFLNTHNAPIAINIYPFLSLYYDSMFPKEFAFFNGTFPGLVDGNITYTNAFDGNLDTLSAALEKHGVGSMPIIVGEVGWPTNGDSNANNANAQRFYQGLIDRINSNKGPPKRPQNMPDVYMFGLVDEDAKSILPGNFEPHWGIFNYDGSIKYQVDLGNGTKLVPSKGVKYMKKQWCVLSPKARLDDPKMNENWKIACGASTGCTSVTNGSACEWMDNRTKASYAFNAFYQVTNQNKDGCKFNGLSIITEKDPSPPNATCKFDIALDVGQLATVPAPAPSPGRMLAPEIEPSPGRTLEPGSNSFAVATKQPNSIALMVLSLMLIIL
ncbi:glucan endo-1,3-beta-glucosidase 5-like [Gastrolobium bilobum]|uniref:glucan endo-1,3-beta-glucosidase 5-like n=1 Tax=Gastrolobium bilobum TaxID=150636 RepID=UPI002AB23C21|nr:glucan endo-1,3-beta-glucosidase 5-like [Gastrolobium bilobum]